MLPWEDEGPKGEEDDSDEVEAPTRIEAQKTGEESQAGQAEE